MNFSIFLSSPPPPDAFVSGTTSFSPDGKKEFLRCGNKKGIPNGVNKARFGSDVTKLIGPPKGPFPFSINLDFSSKPKAPAANPNADCKPLAAGTLTVGKSSINLVNPSLKKLPS